MSTFGGGYKVGVAVTVLHSSSPYTVPVGSILYINANTLTSYTLTQPGGGTSITAAQGLYLPPGSIITPLGGTGDLCGFLFSN